MKKTITFFVAVVLAVSLCSCGNNESTKAPESQPAIESTVESREPSESTEEDAGILYSATVSGLQSGYCVLTLKDALKITPADAFGSEIAWTSSDESVATVEDGLVLPEGPGMAEILLTDGETGGVAIVLVNTAPAELQPAGRFLIEKKGVLYESSVPASIWLESGPEPQYIAYDFTPVYEADGTYYVRAELLLNAICCYYGTCYELKNPEDGLSQLTGLADVKVVEPEVDYREIGTDVLLANVPATLELSNGAVFSADYCTQIYVGEKLKDTVYYHAVTVDEGSFHEPEYFLSRFGVEVSLRYDAELQALILSFDVREEG